MSTTADAETAIRACEALIVAYTHLIDLGDGAKVVDLFTDGGVWESAEATMRGREEIAQAFAQRQANTGRRSRHVCTNIAVRLTSPDTAEGHCYFTLYRADGIDAPVVLDTVPTMIGDYHDTFRRTSDGWRIEHRRASATFVRARAD